MVAMSKKVLVVDFEYDFQLIGISSHAKDYRLSWEINKQFKTLLKKEEDVVYSTKKGDKAKFSMYFFKDEIEERDIRLISNKSNGRYLIPEQKAADYFIILYDYNTFDVNEMLRLLRKINTVLMAFEINVDTLKAKENLVF